MNYRLKENNNVECSSIKAKKIWSSTPSKFIFIIALLILLTGCSEYSGGSYIPKDEGQVIATSEEEAKQYLANSTNTIISTTSGISSQLVYIQSPTVTPSEDDRKSLMNQISSAKDVCDKQIEYISNLKVVSVMENKQKVVLEAIKDYNEVLKQLYNALVVPDFDALALYSVKYDNAVSSLQSASIYQ